MNTASSTADAFGVVAKSESVTNPFGYVAQAGYYTDQSTGLILTTFRYYDPGPGRFFNRDPIGYAGGINDYGYVGNDPENEDDPDGTDPIPEFPPQISPGLPPGDYDDSPFYM